MSHAAEQGRVVARCVALSQSGSNVDQSDNQLRAQASPGDPLRTKKKGMASTPCLRSLVHRE